MKKIVVRAVLICLPVLLFSLTFFFYEPHQAYTLLPVRDSVPYNIYTYSDSVKSPIAASSVIIQHATKDSIVFKYILSDTAQSPFAGITLLTKQQEFLFIDTYDILEIEIAGIHTRRPQILLGLYAQDTVHIKSNTCKYVVKDLDLVKDQKKYRIPLKEFTTPSWWYSEQGISEKDLIDTPFNKLKLVNIQNCQLLERGKEDTITITGIHFVKDVRLFYILSCSLIAIYYLVCFYINLLAKRSEQKVETIEIRYTPIEMENASEQELDKLVAYISSHYDNPELSLKMIQMAIGLSETKVSVLLKHAYQLNFKQYLNKLRLTEAKRLLKDLNVPVSDIAYRVGYGNISHFNRVFKESEGHSPNDYRKKQ